MARRVDLVWDSYINQSLKSAARNKREQGIRRRVLGSSKIPSNWMNFLCVDQNKVQLFAFLTAAAMEIAIAPNIIVATDATEVRSIQPGFDFSSISPCNHEEADTRVLLHAADAVKKAIHKF